MKVSSSQIEQLYHFTREHYVLYYDVQAELVDHLANDIEEIWKQYPNLTFDQARDQSFKKFGVFGFMNMVEGKQREMNKRYWRIIWRFMKEWFTIPKIFMTVFLYLVVLVVIRLPMSDYFMAATLLFIITAQIIVVLRVKKKKKKKEKEKIFLLEDLIGTTSNGFSALIFLYSFNFFQLIRLDVTTLASQWLYLVAILITLLILLFYISIRVIPQKADQLLRETYPEYDFIK